MKHHCQIDAKYPVRLPGVAVPHDVNPAFGLVLEDQIR